MQLSERQYNHESPAYHKTAAMNIVAVDATGDYHLLQIVCNSWWHVGRLCGFKVIPEDVHDIVSNLQYYHCYLQRKYKEKYLGEQPDFSAKQVNFDHSI